MQTFLSFSLKVVKNWIKTDQTAKKLFLQNQFSFKLHIFCPNTVATIVISITNSAIVYMYIHL